MVIFANADFLASVIEHKTFPALYFRLLADSMGTLSPEVGRRQRKINGQAIKTITSTFSQIIGNI